MIDEAQTNFSVSATPHLSNSNSQVFPTSCLHFWIKLYRVKLSGLSFLLAGNFPVSLPFTPIHLLSFAFFFFFIYNISFYFPRHGEERNRKRKRKKKEERERERRGHAVSLQIRLQPIIPHCLPLRCFHITFYLFYLFNLFTLFFSSTIFYISTFSLSISLIHSFLISTDIISVSSHIHSTFNPGVAASSALNPHLTPSWHRTLLRV